MQIAAKTRHGWKGGGSTATLEVSALQDFVTVTGEVIKKGHYKDVACTVSGENLTIPLFDLPTTTDSPTNPNARWGSVLKDYRGRKKEDWVKQFSLDHVPASPQDWAEIIISNNPPQTQPRPQSINFPEVELLINQKLGEFRVADVGVLGFVEADVTPTDAAHPTAVMTNSPLIRSLLAKRVSEVVSGPSHVFDADETAVFVIALNGSVTSSSISFTPEGEDSKVLIISIGQDGIGGRAFAWPADVFSPPVVNTAPEAITNVMLFWDDGQWIPVVTGAASSINSGRETLEAGVATVLSSIVSAASNILLTGQDANASGTLRVENRVEGVSFDIVSSNGGDTGVVGWAIL